MTMEKRAVVEPGRTPSEVSGRPSEFIKNGHALCRKERLSDPDAEKRLAQQINTLYNSGRDASEYKEQ